MEKCPKCGKEIDGDMAFCPSCGGSLLELENSSGTENEGSSKTEDSSGKKGCGCGCGCFTVIIIILVVLYIIGSSEDDTYVESSETVYTPKVTEATTEATTESIDYMSTDVDTLYDELDNNALAASQKYVGKYVAVTGCVGTIDASGKYIVLNRLDNSWVESIHCNVNGDEDVINQIAQLSSGSVVTVYGEITDVGEILGYYMDIHFIE